MFYIFFFEEETRNISSEQQKRVVTCVAVHFITAVAAVRLPVALEGAVDTGAILTLEPAWVTSRAT